MNSSSSSGSALVVKEAAIPWDAPTAFDHELRHVASSPINKVLTGLAALDSDPSMQDTHSHHSSAVIGADMLMNSTIQLDDDQHWIKTIPLGNPDLAYSHLMQVTMCYDAVPMSNKVVVFDTKLQVKKAFFGLIYNSTRTAVLHDSTEDKLVGILSITDFIRVLLKLKKERDNKLSHSDGVLSDAEALATNIGEYEIGAWRDMIAQDTGKLQSFIHISATESLFRAAQMLTEHRIHRLPVMEPSTSNPLYILTHKRLLKFIWLFHQQLPHPLYMNKRPRDIGVGCWKDVRVVHPDTPLVECLEMLLDKGISGLPVVTRDNKVVDMYSRFDAIGIAAEDRFDDLDITVEQALQHRNSFKGTERVVSVLETDTMLKTLSVLVESDVHRVCATDEQGLLKGVISLSDVINFVVLRPVQEHDQ